MAEAQRFVQLESYIVAVKVVIKGVNQMLERTHLANYLR